MGVTLEQSELLQAGNRMADRCFLIWLRKDLDRDSQAALRSAVHNWDVARGVRRGSKWA